MNKFNKFDQPHNYDFEFISSSGIGADAARHLAKLGGKISMVGRNVERLNAVAEQIKQSGSPAPFPIVADVTKDAARIIKETIDHFGKLDILINNAGICSRQTIANVDLADYDRVMLTNVRSVIELSKLAVPHLEKTKGNILNVSSAAGLLVKRNYLAYCISKAALNQLTKSAAMDLASSGIRVNAICAVGVRTPIFVTSGFVKKEEEQEFFDSYNDIYPLHRMGEVKDTSEAIAYLTSDSASFLTGVLMPIDGGVLTFGNLS